MIRSKRFVSANQYVPIKDKYRVNDNIDNNACYLHLLF